MHEGGGDKETFEETGYATSIIVDVLVLAGIVTAAAAAAAVY